MLSCVLFTVSEAAQGSRLKTDSTGVSHVTCLLPCPHTPFCGTLVWHLHAPACILQPTFAELIHTLLWKIAAWHRKPALVIPPKLHFLYFPDIKTFEISHCNRMYVLCLCTQKEKNTDLLKRLWSAETVLVSLSEKKKQWAAWNVELVSIFLHFRHSVLNCQPPCDLMLTTLSDFCHVTTADSGAFVPKTAVYPLCLFFMLIICSTNNTFMVAFYKWGWADIYLHSIF